MMYNLWENFSGPVGIAPLGSEWSMGIGIVGIVLLIIWSIAWKGVALWHSARRGEKVWFVALLVINTVGILEILYLFVFNKKSSQV